MVCSPMVVMPNTLSYVQRLSLSCLMTWTLFKLLLSCKSRSLSSAVVYAIIDAREDSVLQLCRCVSNAFLLFSPLFLPTLRCNDWARDCYSLEFRSFERFVEFQQKLTRNSPDR